MDYCTCRSIRSDRIITCTPLIFFWFFFLFIFLNHFFFHDYSKWRSLEDSAFGQSSLVNGDGASCSAFGVFLTYFRMDYTSGIRSLGQLVVIIESIERYLESIPECPE